MAETAGDMEEPWTIAYSGGTSDSAAGTILLGAGVVSIGGVDVALTRGGSQFTVEREFREINADGDRGVIQGRQQILLDVADIGGVIPHAVHDILHMGTVQLHKAGFHHLRRIIVTGYTDRLSGRTDGIHDQLRNLVKLLTVHLRILNQILIPDVL